MSWNNVIPAPHPEDQYPDPPDNLDFLELFTDEQQAEIDKRFQHGISIGAARLAEARAREERRENMRQASKERRAKVRERYLASRFNPVLRSRP